MAEFIGNFPLALMLIPATTGLILGGYIVLYFFQRRKKSKMKLGYHSSSGTEESNASPTDKPAAEETEQVEEISTDILPPHPTQSAVSSPADTPLTIEDKLDLGVLSKNQETTTAKSSTPEKQETFNLDASPAKSIPMITQNTANSSEDPEELLRLLRDRQSGQLVVEVAGQRYTKLADVTDKKIGQYILKIAAHLLAFTNGVIVTDAGMKSVYKPKLGQAPKPVESSSASPPKVETEPPPKPVAQNVSDTPAPPQTAPDGSTNSSDPPLNPLGASPTSPQSGGLLNRVAQPPPPPSSLSPLNLAEEIDEIVQARLRYSPLAATTFIKITSDLSGGIRINVNGTYYSSPDEVPDQQAKELIQASIKEWEHS